MNESQTSILDPKNVGQKSSKKAVSQKLEKTGFFDTPDLKDVGIQRVK